MRIEAADELLEQDLKHAVARDVLLKMIGHENEHLALYAARCAQLRRLNDDTFFVAYQALAKKYDRWRIKALLAAIERQRLGKE